MNYTHILNSAFVITLFWSTACVVSQVKANTGDNVSFAADVRPILASKCWNCHGPDEETREGDLRLDLRDQAEHVLEEAE